MYELVCLDFSSLSSYKAFLPDKVQKTITKIKPGYKLIAFGANHKGNIVGVCIALLNINLHFLEFLHIEVKNEHRNRGIGRKLIAYTQEEAIKYQAKFCSFIYPEHNLETAAIEKILAANQWQGSRPFLIRAVFDPVTFDAPLLHLNYDYPQGYTEFLWKDLNSQQRADLLYREKAGIFSAAISPFQEEKSMESLNSLGLKFNERVVGWLITHRLDQDTIRYSCFYIEPSLKFRSLSIKILINSLLLHVHSPTKRALIEIPYLQVSSSWIKFIKKRLLPFAKEVTYLKQGWQTLNNSFVA